MTVRLEDRPGVVAIAGMPGRRRPVAECARPVAECARCGRVKSIYGRGLCAGCREACRGDGTIAEYGWVKPDRMQDYAKARAEGLDIGRAAARAGVCERTGWRYEKELKLAGNLTR